VGYYFSQKAPVRGSVAIQRIKTF